MAIVPSFTAVPSTSGDATALILQDTSTGSDGAIVSRQINLYQTDNSQLTGNPIGWAYPSPNPITINPFTQDCAIQITINWLNSGGATLYTASLLYDATFYAELFYATLTRNQSSNFSVTADTNYYSNKGKLRGLIDSANQAISIMSDIFSAETCISLYQNMINNQNDFF